MKSKIKNMFKVKWMKLKCSLDIFFMLRIFANTFSSSSCGSSLDVEFHIFFCRFKNILTFARLFWFIIISIYFKYCLIFHIQSFKYLEGSFGEFFTPQLLMLARSLGFSTGVANMGDGGGLCHPHPHWWGLLKIWLRGLKSKHEYSMVGALNAVKKYLWRNLFDSKVGGYKPESLQI